MKKKFYFVGMCLGCLSLLNSCVSDDRSFDLEPSSASKGSLVLNLNPHADFVAQTRSVNEESYKNTSNYLVQIINTSTNKVVLECKASELNTLLPKTVEIGSYRITASYGTEHDASRDEFFMFGSTVVTVKAGDEKVAEVNCTPTCGKVSVAFDANMATYYEDYNVTFGGTAMLGSKTIEWAKDDSEPWYVALDEGGETMTYTISLTAKDEYLTQKEGDAAGQGQATGTATGTFKLERNKAHKLTIKPSYTPTSEGGIQLSVTIDESTNDKEITYEIPVTWL